MSSTGNSTTGVLGHAPQRTLTKAERIERRRRRLQEHLQAKKEEQEVDQEGEAKDGNGTPTAIGGKVSKRSSRGGAQLPASQATGTAAIVSKARARTTAELQDAEELTSEIRLEADAAHDAHRRAEEARREARNARIEQELAEGAAANTDIARRWGDIEVEGAPDELAARIRAQADQCAELIARKEALLQALHDELKEKDEQFDTTVSQQAAGVSEMVVRMRREFKRMFVLYNEQLQEIEEAFIQGRTELLEAHRAELERLSQRRRDMELEIMEAKQAREDKFQDELSAIRQRDAEAYSTLKVTLENNIQLLEQQLEEMRATYQLNSEKLDYNHRVLKEMDAENKETVQHHREKLKRLKDALAAASQRHAETDKKYRTENKELTDEFMRITGQFKELQQKYQHFEEVDARKYQEVWDMNEEAVMDVIDRLVKADHLIHTQILGVDYEPPQLPAHERSLFNRIQQAPNDDDNNDNDDQQNADDAVSRPVTRQQQQQQKGRFSNEQIQPVMLMLCSEAAFLVDAEVKAAIETLPSEEERNMYLVDNILSSLGIVDREDLDDLVSRFFEHERDPAPSVPLDNVVKVVKSFLATRQQAGSKDAGGIKTDAVSAQKTRKKRKMERRYWKRLASLMEDRRVELWDVVEKGVTRYNEVLREREGLIEETTRLAQENQELRRLLEGYLHDDQGLQIPPTRIIRVEDGGGSRGQTQQQQQQQHHHQ